MDVRRVDAAAVPSATRMFECKKCSRKFSSFQALGGHSSRCKGQCPDVDKQGDQRNSAKVGYHECSICGRSFPTGQALGGHMTLHRQPVNNASSKKPLNIDLNQPPPADVQEEELESMKPAEEDALLGMRSWWCRYTGNFSLFSSIGGCR